MKAKHFAESPSGSDGDYGRLPGTMYNAAQLSEQMAELLSPRKFGKVHIATIQT